MKQGRPDCDGWILEVQITKEIKEEIREFLDSNGYANTTCKNLCDTMTAMVTWKFTAGDAHITKTDGVQII